MQSTLVEAAANGSLNTVERMLVTEGGEVEVDVNRAGRDGTTPLCAAALWGQDRVLQFLLSFDGIDVNCRNDGSGWTALHAAAFQENGRVCDVLLQAGASPRVRDSEGRTPADYASISEAIWPFFQSVGCCQTPKAELIEKRIIRKGTSNTIAAVSRPGSAYVRHPYNPMMQQGRSKSVQPQHPQVLTIGEEEEEDVGGGSRRSGNNGDPFGPDDEDDQLSQQHRQRKPSLRGVY